MFNESVQTTQQSVIDVIEDKCVNCHACIAKCPVKFANNGSGDHVTVNQQLCIACGNCLSACRHQARYFVDDAEAFFSDLEYGSEIIAIVAPSVAANFPGQYLNLNGWLKNPLAIWSRRLISVASGASPACFLVSAFAMRGSG